MGNIAGAAPSAVVVSIGGLSIRVLSDDQSFLGAVKDRYRGFISSGYHGEADLMVSIRPPEVASRSGLRVTWNSSVWSAEREDFTLDWNSKTQSGSILQENNAYSLDAALRILHTLLLAERGGFLLHAASAIRKGKAFLFFGPSGAGKTTIARAAPPDAKLLTDEVSYVRQCEREYFAYGTPFTGDLEKSGENVCAPIAALFHLVKAPTNRLIPMKAADALQSVLESVLFFAEDPHLVKLVFQSACDLAGQVPVYRLEFAPGQSVWDLIQ